MIGILIDHRKINNSRKMMPRSGLYGVGLRWSHCGRGAISSDPSPCQAPLFPFYKDVAMAPAVEWTERRNLVSVSMWIIFLCRWDFKTQGYRVTPWPAPYFSWFLHPVFIPYWDSTWERKAPSFFQLQRFQFGSFVYLLCHFCLWQEEANLLPP